LISCSLLAVGEPNVAEAAEEEDLELLFLEEQN
jgi:hypothetical protein